MKCRTAPNENWLLRRPSFERFLRPAGSAIIPQIESSRMIPASTVQIQGDIRIPEHQATIPCSY